MNRYWITLLLLATASPALAAVPSKPGSLKVSAVSSSALLVKWKNKSSTAFGTKIFRSLSSSGSFDLVGTAAAGATTFSDSSLNSATTYYYRLSAYNAEGDSSLTSAKKGKTKASALPNAPSNLTALGVSTSQINLAWSDNSSNESRFVLEVSSSGAADSFSQLASVSANIRAYSAAGLQSGSTYFFRIKAENADGASAYSAVAQAQTLVPPNQLPVVAVSVPARGNISEEIVLSAAGSSDPDGSIALVRWNFGDGSSADGLEVRHAYASVGVFQVSVTVTDDRGAAVSRSASTRIIDPLNPENELPIARLSAPATIAAGAVLNLSGAASSDVDGTIASYQWNLGDGTVLSGRDITHSYAASGSYRIELVVTDNRGASASASALIGVTSAAANNIPPVARQRVPRTSYLGVPVTFSAADSSDADGQIVQYEWRVNGQTLLGREVTVTFDRLTSYIVYLTVTDNNGDTHMAITATFVAPALDHVLDPALPPGQNFDMTRWKLTTPFPRASDGKPLEIYSSSLLDYQGANLFFSHPTSGAMVFKLDSGQGVTTTNSSHVRLELRERMDGSSDRTNWLIGGTHRMEAEMALVQTTITQVTVMQIHGVGPNGVSDGIDPLLRVTVERDDDRSTSPHHLKAHLARDAVGNDDTFLLKSGVRNSRFACTILVQDGQLIITVDGQQVLNRSISYWPHYNYFKQGLYPQATSGTSELHVYKLRVTHE